MTNLASWTQTVFYGVDYMQHTVTVIKNSNTEDPRYHDCVCYQIFGRKIEFAVFKKLDKTHLKHQ